MTQPLAEFERSEKPKPEVHYCLTEPGKERLDSFRTLLAAKEEGQRRATEAGHAWEGWRQTEPSVWWLLPECTHRIEVTAVTVR